MKIYKSICISLFALVLSVASAQARSTGPVATAEIRDLAAKEYIENHPNYLAIQTNGLVCSSCGIGLRIHTSKIDGVDKSAFTKGIDLDAEKQLVVVAFDSADAVDVDAVRESIYKAGYDPVSYYLWTEANGVTQTAYPVVAE